MQVKQKQPIGGVSHMLPHAIQNQEESSISKVKIYIFYHTLGYRCIYIIFLHIVPNIKLLTGFLSLIYPYYTEYSLYRKASFYFFQNEYTFFFKKLWIQSIFYKVVSYLHYYIQMKNYSRNHPAFTTNNSWVSNLVYKQCEAWHSMNTKTLTISYFAQSQANSLFLQ